MKRAELWRLAGQLVPHGRPDLFNQALMELGATVCTARSPRCESCPISGSCGAFARGRPEAYPAPKRKAPPEEVKAVTGALERHGRLLLLRRPSRGLLGGLWETPMTESERARDLVASLHERTGLRTRVQGTLGQVRHVFTHRALTLQVVRLTAVSGRLGRDSHARWCTPREIRDLPISTPMRKTLRLTGLNLPGPRPV
jgi:A/G-specific adenine glycosylase